MAHPPVNELKYKGFLYFEKIISTLSHDTINAFSVINEMAGLQQDILEDPTEGAAIDAEELAAICVKIRAHVQRGKTAIRGINWITHRADQPEAMTDINETIEKISEITNMWLDTRRAKLAFTPLKAAIGIQTKPFFFAFAVLLSIDMLTAVSSSVPQVVTVGYCTAEDRHEFLITNRNYESRLSREADKWATLASLMGVLGGTIKHPTDNTSSTNHLLLCLPKRSITEANELTRSTKEVQ